MLDPIVNEIEVPCSRETAFDVFVKAERVRGGYGTGWRIIFDERYREACAATKA